ncbi:MAG: DUF2148 domain-containing protein [Candidatus Methanomethylicia archaeon]
MPIMDFSQIVDESLVYVLKLMTVSVKTAPKARGIDRLQAIIVTGEEKNILANEMEKLKDVMPGFERDALNVRNSNAVLLIGFKGGKGYNLNCGGCGYKNCKDFEENVVRKTDWAFTGPSCIYDLINLGIALGSAVKTASNLNVDNRIMFTVGVAAKRLKLMDADVIIGIPVSSYGKSIYFDRMWPPKK